MTVQEAYKQLQVQLCALYDDREAANIADLIIEHVTGQRRIDRVLNKLLPVTAPQQATIEQFAEKLLQHTPVQYVLHEAWFAGMKLYVDENVLIPRPETEELVSWILDARLPVTGYRLPVSEDQLPVAGYQLPVNEANENTVTPENKTQSLATSNWQPVTILDIGTGSGCIPIALKKKVPGWELHAVDISAGAIEVAKRNADAQGTDISFYQLDILDENTWERLPVFDVIVSNPPYIRESESTAMHTNVLAFEPHTALFVPDEDALLFYRKIADFALVHLRIEGFLFFEINEALGRAVCAMLAEKGFSEVELRQDLQERDRMVWAVR